MLDALRKEVNEACWDARCALEFFLVKDGVPDEDAWCDRAAISVENGRTEPEFTREGFSVMNHQRFEQWAVEHGFAHLEWVVDEEAALKELDAANGVAYYEGEEVPGVYPLVPVPRGVILHPSKTARKIVKEWMDEHL